MAATWGSVRRVTRSAWVKDWVNELHSDFSRPGRPEIGNVSFMQGAPRVPH